MNEHNEHKIWQSTKQILLPGVLSAALVIGYLNVTQYQKSKSEPQNPATAIQLNNLATPSTLSDPLRVNTEQEVIDVYQRNSTSVVNVTTRSFQYNNFMELVPREGAGSGFVIDAEGHVVTNFHVVQGGERFFVSFGNVEHSYPAKLVGFDQRNDLAVLKVDAPAEILKPVDFGDSSKLLVGQSTVAIGNPFGLGQTMTTGVVSSLDRDLQAENGTQMSGLIQTDAAINRGNSGGPLFDSSGRVIGVNTLIFSPSGGSVGIGFAIPINTVKLFVPDLIKYGKAQYPWLGVSVLPISPRLAQIFELPVQEGLLIVKADENGSAALAGIHGGKRQVYVGNYEIYLDGDIILSIDGQKMRTDRELIDYLEGSKKLGDILKLTVLRHGEKSPVTIDVPLKTVRN